MPLPAIREDSRIQQSARINPQAMMVILLDELCSRLGDLTDIADTLKDLIAREKFQGRPDVITLSATSIFACLNMEERWHKTPLVTAYIVNDDATYSVEVGINEPSPVMTIKAKETRLIDHTKARERISRIFYRCATAGQTASVRVEGEY